MRTVIGGSYSETKVKKDMNVDLKTAIEMLENLDAITNGELKSIKAVKDKRSEEWLLVDYQLIISLYGRYIMPPMTR